MKNLKITAKLMVGFGSVLVMLIVLGVVAFMSVNNISAVVDQFETKSVINTGYVWQIRTAFEEVQKNMLLSVATYEIDDTEQAMNRANDARDKMQKIIVEYKKNTEIDKDLFVEYEALLGEVVKIREKINEYAVTNTDEARKLGVEMYENIYVPLVNDASEVIGRMQEAQEEVNIEQGNIAENTHLFALVAIIVVFIIAIIIVTIMIILITRSIVHPIKEIEAAADEMAKGKLGADISYESEDELGSLALSMRNAMGKFNLYVGEITYAIHEVANNNFALRNFKEHFAGDFRIIEDSILKLVSELSGSLSQIKTAADQVATSAEQVSSGAQDLAVGATEQAGSVEEISASISEISSQVRMSADNSAKASNMASNATIAITSSNEKMQELMIAMGNINDKSTEISKIIRTIEDIAFQTNILALNAAIEAARAGEAGKGFAVVAEEVRKLAGKSAEAAKNTTLLIEETVTTVGEGVELAEITAKDLIGAVDSVEKTTEIISEITTASNEQAVSIRQVSIGVDQISDIVQTNSATSEESAAATEELFGQANLLNQIISKFTLLENSR